MRLLKETRLNHFGKLAFKRIYWHLLLPGRRLPVPAAMSMAGKDGHRIHRRPIRERGDTMTVATIGGHEVHVDAEGFLTEPDEWDEGLAERPGNATSASS